MNKKLSWVLASCVFVITAGCVQGQFRAIEVDGEFLVSPTLDMATPRAARRTWVVYDKDFNEDPELERHFDFGDAFRIRARLGEFRLEPLRKLRGRWNWEGKPANHFIVLVESSRPEIDFLLCGEVELPGHTSGTADHLLRISPIDSNRLEITISDVVEGRTIEEQCDESPPTHRGRVHVEN